MSTQENVKIKLTKTGTEVEIKSFLDARTSQANQAIYLKYANIDMKKAMQDAETGAETKSEDIVNIDTLPAEAIFEVRRNSVENMVVAINGEKVTDRKAALESLLDLPSSDFDEVTNKIDEITSETSLDPKDAPK